MIRTPKKTNWVLVGLGQQGERLARAISESSHAKLISVVSTDKSRAQSFKAQHGAIYSHDLLQEALHNKKINAVCIATPNHKHAQEVILAAQAGKNILCEKPLALTMREGRAIAAAVKKNRVRCFVDFHLRMHESVKRARELVAKNKLGKLTYIEMKWSIGTLGQTKLPPLPRHMQWREKVLQAGGGAIMARGVHLFDLLRFITGMEINEVRAYMDNTPSTVDRTTIGIVLTDKKTPVVIVTSKIIPEADNSIALHGTKGRLIIRDLFSSDSGTLYTKVFDEFARAQNGKKTVLATLEDGLAVIAITGAFISSSGKKRAVRVR